jgi:putative peptide maturation dehydrogenase
MDVQETPHAANETTVRFRRRRYFVVRVADEPRLEFQAFFRSEIRLRSETQCTLLCPVRGESLPLTAAELALVMTVPVERWATLAELNSISAGPSASLIDLASRGILLSDPSPANWSDLVEGERVLHQMQWHDLAAVYHAHSSWQSVVGTPSPQKLGDDAQRALVDKLSLTRGDPPPHFVRRPDALNRTSLHVPALDGPFFDALFARRTTRAFRSQQPLSLSALEIVLYAVFGTHGIKHEPGISGIKRTSPSGGALHPIEAYLLIMNIEELPPGLYHYETGAHVLAKLEHMDDASVRELACQFTAGQKYFAEAHALVIHVARFDRTFWKYAQHRKAYKAVLMDSAHLSQTFYLTAAHLGLGAFYTAAINDTDIGRRLRLRPLREAPIAINGVGLPDSGRDEMHFIPEPYQPTGLNCDG